MPQQPQSGGALEPLDNPPESVGRALRGYEAMPRSTRIEDRTISPRSMVRALHNLPPMMLLDMMLPR